MLEKFGIVVPVKDPTGRINDKTAFQHFSNDQEKNDIVNVIGLSKAGEGSLSYIEKSDNEIIEPYQFYKSIIDDFQKIYTQGIQPRSITIIRSEFNFKSYYDDSASCTWMDYTLYRNYEEEDPTYDYFALSSNVWGTTSGYQRHIGVIEARQYLPFASDEIIDHDPVSALYCGSVNVAVDLTGGASLSYNYTLSNIPNISCTANYSTDNVYWSLTESWPLRFPIESQVFKSSVSWASTGTYVGIDVFFNSGVHLNDHSWSLLGSGRTINVRYDY